MAVILLFMSCHGQDSVNYTSYSDDCIHIDIPKIWQVDKPSKSHDSYSISFSDPKDSFENRVDFEVYSIKSTNEPLETVFKRLLARDGMIDSTLNINEILTSNLDQGFFAISRLTFEPGKIRKGYFFNQESKLIIINASCRKSDLPEFETIFDQVTRSIVIKC